MTQWNPILCRYVCPPMVQAVGLGAAGMLSGKPRWKKVMSAREVVAVLEADGWEFVRQKGSHRIFVKGSGTIPVPMHTGDLPTGTLKSIKKDYDNLR